MLSKGQTSSLPGPAATGRLCLFAIYPRAGVMMETAGVPLYHFQPGLNKFRGQQVHLDLEPLARYQHALAGLVAYV